MNNFTLREPRYPKAQTSGTVAGLDIGKHSAKLVVADRQPAGWTITRAACCRFPQDVPLNGTDLSRFLGPWLHENFEPGTRQVIANLSSSIVDYELIEGQTFDSRNLNDFVQESLGGILGSEVDLATYDFWLSDKSASQQTLCLAWTSSEYASKLATGLSREGLECDAIDIPAQALARIASVGSVSVQSSIIVDVGGSEVTFVFTNGKECDYIRNRIAFATESAAQTISNSIGIGVNAAEILLSRWGIGDSDFPTHPIELLLAKHLSEWLRQLLFEVRRTIHFFKHKHGPNAYCEITLCGGGAMILGLSRWMESELQTPVRIPELPAHWIWLSAEPFSQLYAQALSLTTYGVGQ